MSDERNQDRHEDTQIREMFQAARRVDEEAAPDFDAVRERRPVAAAVRGRAIRWAAAATLGALMLAGALWALRSGAPFEQDVQTARKAYDVPPVPAEVPTVIPVERIERQTEAIEETAKDSEQAEAVKKAVKNTPEVHADLDGPPESATDAVVTPPTVAAVVAEPLPVDATSVDANREIIKQKLAALGYVGDVPPARVLALAPPPPPARSSVGQTPAIHADQAQGNPNVHGSRSRDFQAVVSGVSNVDPLTGQLLGRVNPNSITAGAHAKSGQAVGGFARVLQFQNLEAEEFDSGFNTEAYDVIEENVFRSVTDHPLSTFSIDVDTASYANVRRFLRGGRLPPRDAVRIEEMINYFNYDYPQPTGSHPFSTTVEIADCPWNAEHRLARIGLKGREIVRSASGGSNLVFLIDVSGSMQDRNKLPLLRDALSLLVGELNGADRVAIVVYAGASGLVLPSTPGSDAETILSALDSLEAGGGTNGGAGLRLAYKIARKNFIEGGVNRVILATDGDFNLGVTSKGELRNLIRKDADDGIFLTTLGFGMGNYKDARLEHLADRGNGNHAYIDSRREARKVLVEQINGTLVTIAKDVKIQVEFNPELVGAYRLIGYENRMLSKEDFNDDKKDAGEIGSGHTVTALYELVPPDVELSRTRVDELRYQTGSRPTEASGTGEVFTVKLRYKEPEGSKSRLIEVPVTDAGLSLDVASDDFRFAAAVAGFGMLLRNSSHATQELPERVRDLGLAGLGPDTRGYRAEFLDLVERATQLR